VILGVGRGFRKALFAAFDVPVKEKRDLFEAALAVMRDAWAGKPVAPDDGDAPPVTLSPLPLQRPHPPIWVAAFGPKALAQAGRLGLPYLCSPIESLPILEQNHAAHREALAAAHGEITLPVPLMRTVFVHRDAAVLRRVRDALEQQAEALARAPSAAIRRAGAARFEDWAVVGEPAAVQDGLARYRERLGMTHLVARTQIPGANEAETGASLEHLAELHAES
jgi:alkanesulfonate monooxygenase SsuD/methylene tetrahydromethanopterin reductase-like flavin-dependent oxidoreductase (luciferase family)